MANRTCIDDKLTSSHIRLTGIGICTVIEAICRGFAFLWICSFIFGPQHRTIVGYTFMQVSIVIVETIVCN